jgi:hypothetical protein
MFMFGTAVCQLSPVVLNVWLRSSNADPICTRLHLRETLQLDYQSQCPVHVRGASLTL